MSINRVIISGNLTRDPELRSTANGTSVLGFGVAVNDRRRNPQTGDWDDVPNFVDCTMFGARAEGISRYLTKGTKVAIEGKLRYSQWERDGQKRSKLEVIVDEIEFMSPRNGGQQPYGGGQQQPYGGQQQPYGGGQQQPYGGQQQYAAPQQNAGGQQQPYAEQPYSQDYQPAAPANQIPPAPDLSVYDEEIPF